MQETKDPLLVVLGTPIKLSNTDPELVNSALDSNIKDISNKELEEKLFSHGDYYRFMSEESEIPKGNKSVEIICVMVKFQHIYGVSNY